LKVLTVYSFEYTLREVGFEEVGDEMALQAVAVADTDEVPAFILEGKGGVLVIRLLYPVKRPRLSPNRYLDDSCGRSWLSLSWY
jgi:hypothetical protein